MTFPIPQRLAANCRNVPERAAWLAELPKLLLHLENLWSLKAGSPFTGPDVSCAWVAPVALADGFPAVLKLSMPHMEGEDEIAGLRFWNGDPTVRLRKADDRLGAMLVERCEPGTSLRAIPEPEQDVVIAGLLLRLWREPEPHSFRSLSTLVSFWTEETLAKASEWPDPGLVREGLNVFAELIRTTPRETLLSTDLHAGNVLQAQREPWLVIDPKPFIGDPAFDATQHLFNCASRLLSHPGSLMRRLAQLLDLDHERIRLWMFARAAAEPRDNWQNERLLQIARTLGR